MCVLTSLRINGAKSVMVSSVLTEPGTLCLLFGCKIEVATANGDQRKHFRMSLLYKKGTVIEEKDFLLGNG